MQNRISRSPAWAISMLALVCACATAALPGASTERSPMRRALPATLVETEARVIVKFRVDSSLMRALSASSTGAAPSQHAQALSSRLGLALTDGRSIGARAQVVKARGMSSQALADRLSAERDVEYAVVDSRQYALAAPNDPLYAGQAGGNPASGQWYLRPPNSATIADSTSVLSSINAEAAWNITTGNASIVVAVLDTGVRLDHPDLAPKLRPGYDFVRASISNDGDAGDADASDPGDACGGATTASWHGTQVAGLVGAATNNGVGMAGAGRDVMLLPVRVLGCGGGFSSDIQAAMLWAAGVSATPTLNPFPAKVINLSLGSNGACDAAYVDTVAQVVKAGVVVGAAAGNEGIAVGTPANCPGVIAVAGVRHAGTKVGYSDLGPEIALSAPAGNCVNLTGPCLFPLLTTYNVGVTTPGASTYTNGGADATLGTSFSAPLVAGTVGLMLSANPALTPAQVLARLKATARAFPVTGAGAGVPACSAPSSTAQPECYCTSTTCGAGMLDASAAVVQAANGVAVANITTRTEALVGSTFALSGASSTPSATNAVVQTYAWSIDPASSIATITGATNASTTSLATTSVGRVSVRLVVTDSTGKSATTTKVLAVVPPTVANIAPSTVAVIAGDSVDLDGSASTSRSGNIVGYQWTITSGSSAASFSGPTTASTVRLVTTAAGVVTVSLTVTDDYGTTSTASRAVTVDAVPSSGGGALGLGWLFGLMAAVAAVRRVTPVKVARRV